ncbi:head-tail adaptor protein [Pelagibacterium lentulum]|uniref:Head-tail adaptor protein n=1 Tax=Pelagibacterium lentulum TaxID=2029865 RepID=A0A916RNI4_9HYPH|nr:head-tail adaptor protein [Pelagibacterium lentulum]GGA63863.1 hypothetical protein GCM10011499_37820 [Pelagibacterium lentulum]
MTAGRLRTRIHCEKRTDDGAWGTPVPGGGTFERQFTTRAELRPMRGGETVMGERLQGRQPYVVRMYRNSKTRQIQSNWRLVDAHDQSRIFAVASPPHDPDGTGAFLDFIAEEGRLP